MNAFGKLATTELKLFLRDRTTVFFVIGLPVLLVVVFGSLAHPSSDHDPLLLFLPAAALCVGLAGLAFNSVPATLAGYREKGILRRMAATPVPPSRVLLAQLTVAMGSAVAAMVLVITTGGLLFGFALPKAPLAFAVAFLLSAAALFAVGLLVASVAPSGRGAAGIGAVIFLLSQFSGGVFVPKEELPATVSRISDFTPLGAAMQAVRTSWTGAWPSGTALLILAGYALVLGAVAARSFRWE